MTHQEFNIIIIRILNLKNDTTVVDNLLKCSNVLTLFFLGFSQFFRTEQKSLPFR